MDHMRTRNIRELQSSQTWSSHRTCPAIVCPISTQIKYVRLAKARTVNWMCVRNTICRGKRLCWFLFSSLMNAAPNPTSTWLLNFWWATKVPRFWGRLSTQWRTIMEKLRDLLTRSHQFPMCSHRQRLKTIRRLCQHPVLQWEIPKYWDRVSTVGRHRWKDALYAASNVVDCWERVWHLSRKRRCRAILEMGGWLSPSSIKMTMKIWLIERVVQLTLRLWAMQMRVKLGKDWLILVNSRRNLVWMPSKRCSWCVTTETVYRRTREIKSTLEHLWSQIMEPLRRSI